MNPTLARFLAPVLLLALVGMGPSARGAETLPSFGSNPLSSMSIAPKPRVTQINIDFPGGSIAQLVAMLNSPETEAFNLIGEKTDQDVQLPAMKLRGLELPSFASAINSLLRSQGLAFSQAGPNAFVLAKNSPLYLGGVSSTPSFQAFQLAPYLTPTLSVDDVIDAINVAWSADPAHDAKLVRFKYHPATKLLFVYGPPEAIAFATQIIPQLNPTATARARYESFRSSSDSVVPNPSPADEQARLDAVNAEVRRRRELRDNASAQAGKTAAPLEKR